MSILLLYKNSTYKNYFLTDPKKLKTVKGLFSSDDMKKFRRTHDVHYWTLDYIEAVLKDRKLKYTRISRGKTVNYGHFDLIITVGGDGTFLEASHHVHNQLILGVNSDPNWSVGRFCVANAKNFESILDKHLKGQATIRQFQRLELSIKDRKRSALVLNDVLICDANPAAMCRYHITVGSRKEDQKSSGMWISTAAGSSGGAQSAGGKVLPPYSSNYQYQPRELYKGSKLHYKLTGAVVKPPMEVSVTSLIRDGVLYIDGPHICWPFHFGHTALFRLSKTPLNIITP